MSRDLGEALRERAKAAEEESKNKGKRKKKLKNIKVKDIPENIASKAKESREVVYDAKGKVVKGRMKTFPKVMIGIAVVLAAFCVSIYIPPLFHKDTSSTSYIPVVSDASALKVATQYYKDNPERDFDSDGLTNVMEDQYGTNGWRPDTDFDGINDYAELYVTESNPTKTGNELILQTQQREAERGETLGDPYKIDNILMWPDDYPSKTYGGVVRTIKGIRFCHFRGWVKFPEKVYAYAYYDGIHHEIVYRADADAWHITDDYEVVLYDQPLTFSDVLELPFIGRLFFEPGTAMDFITNVLPDANSFITCKKMADIDAAPKMNEEYTNALRQPHIDLSDPSRFAQNQNSLDDYMFVRNSLDKGYCVAASLYSDTAGEAIVIIYGYDSDGNFLAANQNLEPVGKLYITMTAMRMMNKDGEIGQVSWFEWSGLGFSSLAYGDRINFISSTASSSED